MLKIKRVPTLLSNYQNYRDGCGRNCLNHCCLTGATLPLYCYSTVQNASRASNVEPVAFLDSLLLGEWEDRAQRGLFRYDVTSCETKVIPGKSGFIAQLNEGRHLKKRPTEFRVDQVLQPFDNSKFNFTKIGQEEVLFQLTESENGDVQFFPNAPIDIDSCPNVIAINVSPIEYGHVLLIPRIFECLPQMIDHQSCLLAIRVAMEAGNPYFRLGYNSLGAFATINHLHFQAYYLAVPFPIEKTSTEKLIITDYGVKISELLEYPVRGLVFENGKEVEDLANTVSDSCICLQEKNIPYNILISDSGKRIFLIPQCYAEKQALGEVSTELLDTQVNPAVWEISGHMVLKRKKDYDQASEENAWKLLAEVSLSADRFEEVKVLIFEATVNSCNPNGNVKEPVDAHDLPATGINKANSAMATGKQECLVKQ